MGTSLSGLTPATTFDGLLKTSDNEPLDGTLKTIGTGDGTDSILQLSNSALQIGGATGMYWDNTNKRFGLNDTTPTSKIDIKNTFGASSLAQLDRMGMFVGYLSASFGLALGGASSTNSGTIQGTNNTGNAPSTLSLNPFGGNVGILDTQATARLHIKGSGATSATTSLLVQNSAGTQLLKINDDGSGFFGTYLQGQRIYANATGETFPSFSFSGSSGTGIFQPTAGSNIIGFSVSGGEKARLDATGLGIGETTPTARLHVKGSGNDNTTTSLLVQNSDGDDMMKVQDDGFTNFISKDASNHYLQVTTANTYNGFKFVGGANSREWRTYGGQGTWFSDSLALSTGFQLPTAKLQVKGSGATSATTALLVENSAGTDLLKVDDDGDVSISGKAYFAGFATIIDNNKIYTSNTSNGFIQLTSNNLEYSDTSTSGKEESAALTLTSTTRGFLPPRMTTTQRDAISSPASGLMVYNTTTNKAQCYNGTAWQDLF